MREREDELTLERDRTPEFFEAARALSDFISGLDLSVEQNNNLVRIKLRRSCGCGRRERKRGETRR